jgi:hypothetical protein
VTRVSITCCTALSANAPILVGRVSRPVRELIILLAVEIEVSFVSPFPRSRRRSRWERNFQKSPGLSMARFQTARGINVKNERSQQPGRTARSSPRGFSKTRKQSRTGLETRPTGVATFSRPDRCIFAIQAERQALGASTGFQEFIQWSAVWCKLVPNKIGFENRTPCVQHDIPADNDCVAGESCGLIRLNCDQSWDLCQGASCVIVECRRKIDGRLMI